MVYTCWGGSFFVRFWLLFATLFLVIFLNFRTPLKLGGGVPGGVLVISVIVGGVWVVWGGVCGGFIISEVIEVYLFLIMIAPLTR